MKLVLALLLSINIFAGYEQDIASIKKLTGCYSITYQDAETFSPNPEYKFYDRFSSGGLEWIFVEKEQDNEIALLHLLIIPGGHIVKHWRQLWRYEDAHFYSFEANNTFLSKEVADATGRWTQAAYQVGGGPRYECSAPWIHWGSVEYWECESNSPLPRREFSVRSDYNILKRRNRHEITSYGHAHAHDGTKINRTDKDNVIAFEKGKNVYKKVADSKCEAAQKWWPEHQLFWETTHAVWDAFYDQNQSFKLESKVDGKVLWQHIFSLDSLAFEGKWDEAKISSEVFAVINKFYNEL
jgi:hypothetical protein